MDFPREMLGLLGFRHTPFELWWKHRRRFEPKTAWNERQQAFFVHIPKTAGTSIYDSLAMDPLPYTHAPARVLESLYPAEFASYFTFTFVRNPWDRFVSTYEFLKDGTTWDEQKRWAERHIGDLPFEAFVEKIGSDALFRNRILSYNFFFSQSYFTNDRHGRLAVDRVYSFERLDEGFAELMARFGVDRPLAHRRKSASRNDFRSYYSPKSWAIVGRLYASDIAAFGYGGQH